MNFTVTESTIDALSRLQNALGDLLSSLEVARDQGPEASSQRPEAGVTLEELKEVVKGKCREGKTAMLKMILNNYGVEDINKLDPVHYEDMLKKAQEL